MLESLDFNQQINRLCLRIMCQMEGNDYFDKFEEVLKGFILLRIGTVNNSLVVLLSNFTC